MASVLYRLGRYAATYRWALIAAWLVILLGVGTSAAAFRGQLTNDFQIPGTETQQMLNTLKSELPQAAGGSGGVVFEAPGGFTQAQRDAIAAALTKVEEKDYVQNTVNPFQQQEQLDGAAGQLAAGRQQLSDAEAQLSQTRAQLDAAKARLEQAQERIRQAQSAGMPVPEAQQAQLSAQQAQYDAGEAQWAAGQARLTAQRQQLDTAEQRVQASQGLRFVSESNTVAQPGSSSRSPCIVSTPRHARKSRMSSARPSLRPPRP